MYDKPHDYPTLLFTRANIYGLLPITNSHRSIVLEQDCEEGLTEPNPGSVVLIHGRHGTGWQRSFEDPHMWRSMDGGRARPWSWIVRQRAVYLAYGATTREDHDG